jgi:hypothetical protein
VVHPVPVWLALAAGHAGATGGDVKVKCAGTGILKPGCTQACGGCPVTGYDIRQGVQGGREKSCAGMRDGDGHVNPPHQFLRQAAPLTRGRDITQ